MSTVLESIQAERFRAALTSRLGLQFDDARIGWLADVLRTRVEVHREPTDVYLAKLESGASRSEVGALAQDLTVAETYFFRDPDQFRALREDVCPELRARTEPRQLRLLCAGCASGEEAYSLAMTLLELMPQAGWHLSIRAVDLNPAAIDMARTARYGAWSLRETPADQQQRWFHADGRDYVLDDAIRACVTFEERNLCENDPELWLADTYDVVFCRNVLRYFSSTAARAAVARIARSLAPGGYLFLGHTETLRGLSHGFHLRHTQGAFYYQRKDEAEAARYVDAVAATQSKTGISSPALAAALEAADSWVEAVGQAAQRIHALTASGATPTQRMAIGQSSALPRGRAFNMVREERYAEALGQVRAWHDRDARDAEDLLLHAVLLVQSGHIAQAEEMSRRLLALDDLNPGAHYVLALCREGASDPLGAAQHDEAAAYLDPDFAMPRLHLALLARRAGDRDTQRRERAQALALLNREDPSRLLLFGGGFGRDALMAWCRAELRACGVPA